jgi:NADH-quinone oxidoreductase subunit L
VAIVGAATAVVAATIGITQYDIKKVIAYSTVSQLGYMVFALGVGAWVPAIFHLFTHAFFKGLLFLGAGSVIHGMHDEQDMRGMGNLKKYMPITYWTFLIGSLANAGLFPFAGFWSKDETIVGAWAEGHPFVAIAGLVAAFGTALYMMRVVYLTFHGTERFDPTKVHPHDPPWSMKAPLILLAIPAAIAGLVVGLPPDKGWIHDFLEPVFAQGRHRWKLPVQPRFSSASSRRSSCWPASGLPTSPTSVGGSARASGPSGSARLTSWRSANGISMMFTRSLSSTRSISSRSSCGAWSMWR